MLSSSCKNTLFFVSTKCVRIQPRPSLRNGTVRSAKSNRSELFIAAFGRKTRGGGHGGTSDRKIPYLRHTPRALRNAPRTLASSPWARYRPAIRRRLVSDVRAKTKAAMNLGILLPSLRSPALSPSRDNEDRSRCYVDLYRGSDVSWRPEARKIRERTRGPSTVIGVEAKTCGR